MLMYAYTDATAAAQALMAAQFATVLQVVWRAIWQFLDAILLAAWWLGIGWLPAPIISASPAYRWHSPRPQQSGPPPTSPGSISYAVCYSACSSRYGLRGGSRSSWCFAANRKQLPPLPCHDPQHAVVPLAANTLFAVTLLWPRGNAAFLMVNVTLLGWIAALAPRLARCTATPTSSHPTNWRRPDPCRRFHQCLASDH